MESHSTWLGSSFTVYVTGPPTSGRSPAQPPAIDARGAELSDEIADANQGRYVRPRAGLRDTPDGPGGSLLDHCSIFCTTDICGVR